MNILPDTMTREEAVKLLGLRRATDPTVTYLRHLDVDLLLRQGYTDGDTTIDLLRIREDSRPRKQLNKVTGLMVPKAIDVITYKQEGELYVLGMSGGISLFNEFNDRRKLGKKGCWYILDKNVPIPDGIIIAKNAKPYPGGRLYHYAFQPAYDMKYEEFVGLLRGLIPYLAPVCQI
ncbi:MAG: hypothetical protein HY308_11215 [Gammaproteobacteria bacterium]|nr:hypothetical protein [Gammaproteobacteria bacterium]